MLQAIGKTIIVQPIYEKKKETIIIPRSALEYKQYYGQVYGLVISIGKYCKFKDDLKIGDIISFTRHEGKKIIFNNKKYFVLRERWILAIIK